MGTVVFSIGFRRNLGGLESAQPLTDDSQSDRHDKFLLVIAKMRNRGKLGFSVSGVELPWVMDLILENYP